jgi:flagellar hook-length control protein FliK
MTSLPITPPTARVGTALGKSTGSPPGGASGDFAALLTETTARTAHAEGPKTRPQDTRRDAAAPRADEPVAQGDDAPAPATPQAVAVPAPPSEAPATPAPEAPATPQGEAAPAPPPPADPAAVLAVAVTQAAMPAPSAAAPTGAPQPSLTPPGLGPDGVPADPRALVLAQAVDGPPVADPDATATDATPGKLAIPAELLNTKAGAHAGGHGKDLTKDGSSRPELPPAPTLPPTADAPPIAPSTTATTDAAPTAAAPQAPPALVVAQGQPTATAPTVVPTAPGMPQLTRGSVVQAAEHVQDLVRIATARNGHARATLQLRPEALGQVDVHLRTTREGLVATIAAHDQAGLDALQQAGNELRRQLEDRGVQLHSLDLQLDAGAESFANQGDARQAESGRAGTASSYDLDGDEDAAAEDELILTTAPSTSASSLVDVTA